MFRDTEASTTPQRYIDTPEYRRLVYKWMRREARMGGNLRRRSALECWKRSGEYVAAVRSVETVLQPKGVAGLWSVREAV